ncbi:hypothetical protein BTO18_11755 [Polaribacter porphyrae]|uniref:Uncharacterized protein n=1 Tax=Polaribacter porphyrae TaxID=1137780 RepID=A0A2S7WQB8_9FLAO|nr:hypothetical protein BTO18_11755 [Polaribacter porphyrae]
MVLESGYSDKTIRRHFSSYLTKPTFLSIHLSDPDTGRYWYNHKMFHFLDNLRYLNQQTQ